MERVDRVAHVSLQIDVLGDGAIDEILLAIAQALVIGFAMHVEPIIGAGGLVRRVEGSMVHADARGLGVGIDVGGGGAFVHDDGHGAIGRDHILHEEGGLGHHRAPAGFVPADAAIIEQHLELAVIVHALRQALGQLQAHAAHLDRLGVGDLAHDIDIVHAAIDDGRGGLHDGAVNVPGGAARLLVEIHAEHVRATQDAGLLDELEPGGVVAQDIADDELALVLLGGGDDASRVFDGGRQGLFDKDMGAGLDGGDGIVGMGIGVGGDRDHIGLELGQGCRKVMPQRIGRQLFRQGRGGAVDQADDLEAGMGVIGDGVALAHLAEADNQNLEGGMRHSLAPRYQWVRRALAISAAPKLARASE